MSFFFPGAITACSAVGRSWEQTWQGLVDGRSGLAVSPAAYEWPEGPPVGASQLAGQDIRYVDRMGLLIGAVLEPMPWRVLSATNRAPGSRLHVVLASSHGDPGLATEIRTSSAGADFEAMVFRSHADTIEALVDGPCEFTCLHGACASGIIAAVQANDLLNADFADQVLVISTDALSLLAYMGFRAVGAMDTGPCKPFGQGRRGMSVGEGAVAMLLSRERAGTHTKGVAVSIRGGAWSCDGSGGVEPSDKGLVDTIRSALESARTPTDEIDFVYWHGTGTKRNDEVELRVCQELWPAARVPPGASTKGNLAHTMGASAAFNIAASYETILSSILPGLSYEEDARFGYLNLSRQARKLPQARNGLCVAMGFGGINAAVVIGRDLGD